MNEKFENADSVKKTFGFIGIMCLTIFVGIFFINDFLKLVNFFIKLSITQKKLKQKNSAPELSNNYQIDNQTDGLYSDQLAEKIERIHLDLLKAIYKNRSSNKNFMDV